MNTTPDQRRNATVAASAAAGLALLPALILIAINHNAGRAASDSIIYHERFIRQLAADWPRFDLSDPLTATTPAYHILLATAAVLGLDSEPALRLLSALIGAAFAALVAAWCARLTGVVNAILLTLPLACSVYTLGSTAWMLPDNLAWALVAAVIMLALARPPEPEPADHRSAGPLFDRDTIGSAAVLIALVFTRQIHIWAAGVVWLAAWFNARPAGTPAFAQIPARLTRVALAVLLTLPAFLVVAWFVRHWGGLTPPRFQSDITGVNPATPAFILVQIAILGIGFGPWLVPATLRAARQSPWILALAAAIGILLAVIPPTTHSIEAGRYSGWWSLARATPPLFGHTSPVTLVLAPLGAVLLAGALFAAPRRTGWVLLGALIAFAGAQSATINSWQRYHEPFLIILLAMLAASQPAQLRATPLNRLRAPAMGLLALILSAVTVLALRGPPIDHAALPPPKHTSPGDPWAQPPASQQIQEQPGRTDP